MAQAIRQSGVADVVIVPVSRLDWLLTSWGFGWRRDSKFHSKTMA